MKREYQSPKVLFVRMQTESFIALSTTMSSESAQEVARGRSTIWDEEDEEDDENYE
jgi:hypothetical protein